MYYPIDRPMVPEQREILAASARLWQAYGPLLREQEVDLAGGMQWRLVDGITYLTRFRPDPHRRSQKLTKSLGRRSPQTERVYTDFIARRQQVERDLAALAPRIAMTARAARSMGVARLDRLDAEQIHRLRRAGFLDEQRPILVPLGAPAIVAYEVAHGTLAKTNVVRDYDGDDALTLYVRADQLLDRDFAGKVARALFTAKACASVEPTRTGGFAIYTHDTAGERHREVELVARSTLRFGLGLREVPGELAEEITTALEDLPTVMAVVPAADGSVEGYPVPDPRAYAMTLRLFALAGSRPDSDDLLAFRRASFVVWSIRNGVMLPAFTDRQEAALAALGYPNPMLGFDPTYQPAAGESAAHECHEEQLYLRGP